MASPEGMEQLEPQSFNDRMRELLGDKYDISLQQLFGPSSDVEKHFACRSRIADK